MNQRIIETRKRDPQLLTSLRARQLKADEELRNQVSGMQRVVTDEIIDRVKRENSTTRLGESLDSNIMKSERFLFGDQFVIDKYAKPEERQRYEQLTIQGGSGQLLDTRFARDRIDEEATRNPPLIRRAREVPGQQGLEDTFSPESMARQILPPTINHYNYGDNFYLGNQQNITKPDELGPTVGVE